MAAYRRGAKCTQKHIPKRRLHSKFGNNALDSGVGCVLEADDLTDLFASGAADGVFSSRLQYADAKLESS